MNLMMLQRSSRAIDDICNLNWDQLDQGSLSAAAIAYYYFSVQFRENLELACDLFPTDAKLMELRAGECETSNLSPFPGIAGVDEKMNHDEFMRRIVSLCRVSEPEYARLEQLGRRYLRKVETADPLARAMTIASYEDGGLERVFSAILRAPDWDDPALQAFRHFLIEHIRFDSDVDGGHGLLSRHLAADDRISPLWIAFYDMFVEAIPQLVS